jgi:hypothetical protein
MKVPELLAKVEMRPVSKARNLREIGWADGYMVVRFWTGPSLWIYGPAIPEVKRDQILANPYPDSLFTKAIKNKFQCHHVGQHPASGIEGCWRCDGSGCIYCSDEDCNAAS